MGDIFRCIEPLFHNIYLCAIADPVCKNLTIKTDSICMFDKRCG